MDPARYAADAIQDLVMKQDRYTVRSELDIAFEIVGAGRERGMHGSAGIHQIMERIPAMRHEARCCSHSVFKYSRTARRSKFIVEVGTLRG